MPKIPQDELDRIKSEIDLAALVRAKGVELKSHGAADLIGRCPFHNDKTPSLVITPSKGLWHCLGACQAGGSVVDWVMKTEGVSFRHAVTILSEGKAAPLLSGQKIVSQGTTRKLACPLALDADDQALLNQVTAYYHDTLKQSPKALEYLRHRGIDNAEALSTFKLGYADRTLGLRLPEKNREAGAVIRERLQKLGVYRDSGHEHLSGSIVIPILDAEGNTRNLYGRKILDNLRPGTAYHLYLPGPHRGVFNPAALKGPDLILCESLIDALSFWVNGFKNVTCAYGVEGFTEEMLSGMLQGGVCRVFLAYDRDEAGDRAAEKLGEKLISEGLEALRVQFPPGMDANEYIQKVKPAENALRVLLHGAEWMGKGKKPSADVAEPPSGERVDVATGEVLEGGSSSVAPGVDAELLEQVRARYPHLQAAQQILIAEMWERRRKILGMDTPLPPYPAVTDSEADPPSPSLAASLPAGSAAPEAVPEAAPASGAHLNAPAGPRAPGIPYTTQGEDVYVSLGDRSYRVRGLFKNAGLDTLRVNLRASLSSRSFLDTVDLLSAKGRDGFVSHAALELEVKPDIVKRDLNRLLFLLEELQEQHLAPALKAKTEPAMSERERDDALVLARAPGLWARICADLAACGYVGEEVNKQVGYLAALSRRLPDPLSLLIQSSSAAGKSSLMDAILSFVPPEERVTFSAMTGQALFYMEKDALKHKALAIAEDGGMERAAYALKLLITEKRLAIASTGKDEKSGKHQTLTYEVEGPAAVLYTTTGAEVDPELKNRCITLTVDEERAQTRAIHAAQRRARTLEGRRESVERRKTELLHHDLQRLLKPVAVLNPYADRLTFLDTSHALRRDQMKYLGLIDTVAYLHQHQRPRLKDSLLGEYIEVTPEDIRIANALSHEVLGRSLDELAPQTRRLLALIRVFVEAECKKRSIAQEDFRFTRWDVRLATGWGNTQLKLHLSRLQDLEYLGVHRGRRGVSFEYELMYHGEGKEGERFALGLLDVETLASLGYDGDKSGVNAKKSGSSRAQVAPLSGDGREGITTLPVNRDRVNGVLKKNDPENAYLKVNGSTSHPNHTPLSLAAEAAGA